MFTFISNNKDIKHLLDEIGYFKLFEDQIFDLDKFIDFKNEFKKNHTQRYIACLLKFIAFEFSIERIFIILDDMENLKFDVARKIVQNICKIIDCLHHMQGNNVFTTFLISCRPYTHSLIKHEMGLDAWTTPDPINYEDPVSLSEVFKKKIKSIVKKEGEGHLSQGKVDDLEKWRGALESLYLSVEGLCERRGYPISTLNNNDIRGALCSLVRVLKSSFWHNSNIEGAFSPELSEKIQETQAMFIRALSIRSDNGNLHSENCVFNIFQNKVHASSDLLFSFICSYLIITKDQAIPRKELESSLKIF